MSHYIRYRSPIWRAPCVDITRRQALLGVGTGLATMLAPRIVAAQAQRSCVLTPDSGEGPFYFDPGLVRTDITSGAAGAPLDVAIQVLRTSDCAVLSNARVDLWHADALGLYSGYERQSGVGGAIVTDVSGQSFLRGTQFTDANGEVRFHTVYPSWYGGRTPHLHFKIFVSERELIASQIFFPEEINVDVFESWEPYRSHRQRRRGFNANDTFVSDGVAGVFCEAEASVDGYRSEVAIAIAPT